MKKLILLFCLLIIFFIVKTGVAQKIYDYTIHDVIAVEELVVFRGIGRIDSDPVIVKLPNCFKDITELGSETIHLTETSIGQVYVESIDFGNNSFTVNGKDNTRFTWLVIATRKGYTDFQAEYKN